MTRERKNNTEGFDKEVFLETVGSAWPESVVVDRGHELLPDKLNVCVIFCPLYSPGPLSESKLIRPPMKIIDSRVSQKAEAYASVLKVASDYLGPFGGSLSVKAVFANRGVLFGGEPTGEEKQYLNYHGELYKSMMQEFSQMTGSELEFYDYDDLGVKFERLIDPNKPIPEDAKNGVKEEIREESKVIVYLNNYLGPNLPFEIIDNKKTRKVIKSIMSIGIDIDQAFWLIAGYMAFDHKIPQLVGKNGIYLVSERFGPLFRISKFTPELDNVTRIQLKA